MMVLGVSRSYNGNGTEGTEHSVELEGTTRSTDFMIQEQEDRHLEARYRVEGFSLVYPVHSNKCQEG